MNILFWLNENFNLLRKVHTLKGMETSWKPDLEISGKATIDELNFIFDQATKRVEQTAQEGDLLYSKSITLIAICITVLSALVGYIITSFGFIPSIFASVIVSFILIRVLSNLKECVMPTRYLGSGSFPKDLFIKAFYENLEDKTPVWYMKMSEIIMYQRRLEINLGNNKRRNERLGTCFRLIYALPYYVAGAIILYYIIFFLTYQGQGSCGR